MKHIRPSDLAFNRSDEVTGLIRHHGRDDPKFCDSVVPVILGISDVIHLDIVFQGFFTGGSHKESTVRQPIEVWNLDCAGREVYLLVVEVLHLSVYELVDSLIAVVVLLESRTRFVLLRTCSLHDASLAINHS